MLRRLAIVLGAITIIAMSAVAAHAQAPSQTEAAVARERINIDKGWRFALGHATDRKRDFGYGGAAFFFAKAGYGDGPASPKFDDRAWRELDLPHDWAVEMPFDARASGNHGSKAVGPGFPEHNIGWYRKSLPITAADKGRRIVAEFDGVYRDAVVWFNGHYIGQEHSGYSSFAYDLTDYVNYDGPNVLVVRADASVEEGWFYEGAGIYRHVWLTKTDALHVARWGTFVSSVLKGSDAALTARTTVRNDDVRPRAFTVRQEIYDAQGHSLAVKLGPSRDLAPGGAIEDVSQVDVPGARLWSVETPYLHRLVTTITENGQVRDRYETTFGVREVRWDAQTGFWLNGKNIKLRGVNMHQDHAGVGVALPDALQVFRLERLKAMGANAYRVAHHPPTPEMLDAADRLGIVVIDEHRLMGTSPEITDQLTRLIERDRNHPSVVLWSVGNEEWAIEGAEMGARLTALMQAKVRALDPTRATTVAISGGAPRGSSSTTEVVGFNYRAQHDVDAYHKLFPDTPALMTEEGSTFATRGVYVNDTSVQHIAAYDRPQRPNNSSSIEQGWRAVAERPWMAGMFVWTGFDYRGETTPFGWPAISSQFGMLDTTGLFKDSAYYLKSWWSDAPMVHIVGHWNWPDRAGQTIPIWIYSNADEVELLINGASLGRKPMPRDGHLEWSAPYARGVLLARGYRNGRVIAADEVATAGPANALHMTVDRKTLAADGRDMAVVTVSAVDAWGRLAPLASDSVNFTLAGRGRLIGVGNGDPSSHQPDRFVDGYAVDGIDNWRMASVETVPAALPALDSLTWRDPFAWFPPGSEPAPPKVLVLRGRWSVSSSEPQAQRTLYLPLLKPEQRVFVDGRELTGKLQREGSGQRVLLPADVKGEVDVVILVGVQAEQALRTLQAVGVGGTNVAYVQTRTPAAPWGRKLFNGYAQVLLQAGEDPGAIVLSAKAPGLASASVEVRATLADTFKLGSGAVN